MIWISAKSNNTHQNVTCSLHVRIHAKISQLHQFICTVDPYLSFLQLYKLFQHVSPFLQHSVHRMTAEKQMERYTTITWEQTGSDALPALQQLCDQRLLSVQRSLTGLGGNLSEGDLFFDGRVAEGVRPATELWRIWVILKVTGWSSRWGITRGVALLGEQKMNQISVEMDPTPWRTTILYSKYMLDKLWNPQILKSTLEAQLIQESNLKFNYMPDRNKQSTEICMYNLQVSD